MFNSLSGIVFTVNINKITMKILGEFKKFAMRGNVVDLAVGVIIGGAFGKIVSSLVNDVIMPIIGILLGGVNFTNLKIVLKDASENVDAITINYGIFLQTTVDFLIIAFSIFIMVKGINVLARKKEQAPEPAKLTNQEKLLMEIRDLLKNK